MPKSIKIVAASHDCLEFTLHSVNTNLTSSLSIHPQIPHPAYISFHQFLQLWFVCVLFLIALIPHNPTFLILPAYLKTTCITFRLDGFFFLSQL